MRLRVTLSLEKPLFLPLNYQDKLTGVVYAFLERANPEYARFLHDDGYPLPGECGAKRFKLFCFSPLLCARRRIEEGALRLGPGTAEWLIASPLEEFLVEFAGGLMAMDELHVGREVLPIAGAETLPAPAFGSPLDPPFGAKARFAEARFAEARFKCLSPIVAATASAGRDTPDYLRPWDARLGEHLRRNLVNKYAALHGKFPADERLCVTFDDEYLKTHRGTKLICYKGTEVVGSFAPLTLCGSTALIETAYDCGLGEKNAAGFGMIEVLK